MVKKIILGGIVGGVLMFLAGGITHMATPLGEVGIKVLPNEPAVLVMLKDNVHEPGFYFFPGMPTAPGASAEEKQAAQQAVMERYHQGPTGIMVFHPNGRKEMSPRLLGTELFTDILCMLVAACVLALAFGSAQDKAAGGLQGYGARLLVVVLLGLLPGLDVDLSYWNWYGFPTSYTAAAVADHVITWLVGGLGLAALVKR